MKILQCPSCERTVETAAKNGELVKCPFCGAESDLHDDSAIDLTTNREFPVCFLESLSR